MTRLFYHQSTPTYWLTRFVFLRLLGLVYFIAFLSLAHQIVPLIGEHGILPAANLLGQPVSKIQAFEDIPTIFWINYSDTTLQVFAWMGVLLSAILLLGYANVPILLVLWFIYMSFIHISQLWLSYGWETQLLETGFLALFLVPLWNAKPFPKLPPPTPIIWLLRWLTFRIHLGAGLIKLRGDSCWMDLTCLQYHFETQPVPGPLSSWFHFLPHWIHKFGVLWNHFIELIAPFFVFGPRLFRHVAGVLLLSFQLTLIASGNLSFLNLITIVAIIGCFDDSFLQKILPNFITKKATTAMKHSKKSPIHTRICWMFVVIVLLLSVPVISNLFSSHQSMNRSYGKLHIVNTYGAFGSIGKERHELILEGTTDGETWIAYAFKVKPGDVSKKPPFIFPYHYRLDWQIWFAAMGTYEHNPWLIHIIWKLLHNDPATLSLLSYNPFPDEPPKQIRVEYYKYELLPPNDPSGDYWKRERLGVWLPPLYKELPQLQKFIRENRWNMYS